MLKNIKGLILDMDGVLWKADQQIGNLKKIFSNIKKKNIPFAFATNNSTKSINQYVEKLILFGVNVIKDQIFTSGNVTAEILSNRFPEGGNIYIIGENGLVDFLTNKGFKHSVSNPQAVVVGLDREINYEKLATASLLVRAGIPFIGTNPDKSYPTPQGLSPGAGSILAAIEAATDVKPEIIGKPNIEIYNQAITYLNINQKNILVVGDRLETDIVGGNSAGCKTALVFSGVTSRELLSSQEIRPDFTNENLNSLINRI